MLSSIFHWRRVSAQAPGCVHLKLVGSQELHHIRILPFRRSTRTEWTLGSALQVRRVPGFDDQLHVPLPGDVTGSVESRNVNLRDVPGEIQWLRHRTAFLSVEDGACGRGLYIC